MHFLYFVATKKDKQEADEVTRDTMSVLENNNFAGEQGYWGGSKGDWCVIGGRWSGHLQEIQLDKWHEKATELVKNNRTVDFITNADIDNNKKALQDLWEELGGKGQNSWDRDRYASAGVNDDTMFLDEKLYKALKAHKYTETEVAIVEDNCVEEEIFMKDFLKKKDIVNNYYLTVVDYHN